MNCFLIFTKIYYKKINNNFNLQKKNVRNKNEQINEKKRVLLCTGKLAFIFTIFRH